MEMELNKRGYPIAPPITHYRYFTIPRFNFAECYGVLSAMETLQEDGATIDEIIQIFREFVAERDKRR